MLADFMIIYSRTRSRTFHGARQYSKRKLKTKYHITLQRYQRKSFKFDRSRVVFRSRVFDNITKLQ